MIIILDNGVPKNPKILLDVGRWASWVPLLGAAMLTLPSYPNSVSFFELHPALPANPGAQLLLLFFSVISWVFFASNMVKKNGISMRPNGLQWGHQVLIKLGCVYITIYI